jgi:predicted DCC family thiol-disulfide oxidoreductase YuxK
MTNDRSGGAEVLPALLYDQDCGFCRWSVEKIAAWSGGKLQLRPLQDSETGRLIASVRPDRRMESWHLVTADGVVYSAGDVFPELLRYLPGSRSVVPIARKFRWLFRFVYPIVARNRHHLSRLVGATICAVPGNGDGPATGNGDGPATGNET